MVPIVTFSLATLHGSPAVSSARGLSIPEIQFAAPKLVSSLIDITELPQLPGDPAEGHVAVAQHLLHCLKQCIHQCKHRHQGAGFAPLVAGDR